MAARILIPIVLVLTVGAGALLATTQLSGDGEGSAGAGAGGPTGPASPDAPAQPANLVDLEEEDLTTVLSADSIPSLDDPTFVPVAQAGFLASTEPVAVLEVNGDARAYPLQIMTWHEIVNDEVGGEPITITYCPLCNSSLAYDRRVGGRVLDFGTSGSLYNSALVMYDRQTETKWLHFEGLAVIGELEGTRLEFIPVQTLSLAQFEERYPDGMVLSDDTGFDRPYGTNPYDFYDTANAPFLFRGEVDERMDAMTRIVGVEIDDEAVAIPYERFSGDAAVAEATVGGTNLVVFWQPGVNSALDTPEIATGRDVGTTGVFIAEADGDALTFDAEGDGFVDRETGSRWSLTGEALSGPLAGTTLELVNHLDTFWFAWASHNPDTTVLGA